MSNAASVVTSSPEDEASLFADCKHSDPRAGALKALAPRGDSQAQTSVHAFGLWQANQSLWRNLSLGRTCRPRGESGDIPA